MAALVNKPTAPDSRDIVVREGVALQLQLCVTAMARSMLFKGGVFVAMSADLDCSQCS